MQPHPGILVTLALGTGMAAAFNPCGIGLLPSYVGFLLSSDSPRSWLSAFPEGLRVGAPMTLGLITVFGIVAAAFSVVAGWLGPHLEVVGVAIGAALSVWGGLMLWAPHRFARSPHIPYPAAAGGRGILGAYVYGVVFSLASLGCTFPLFLSLVLQATASGSAASAVRIVLAYGLGMGVSVTALAVLARLAKRVAVGIAVRAAPLLARWMGAFVLASGMLLLGYWLYGI